MSLSKPTPPRISPDDRTKARRWLMSQGPPLIDLNDWSGHGLRLRPESLPCNQRPDTLDERFEPRPATSRQTERRKRQPAWNFPYFPGRRKSDSSPKLNYYDRPGQHYSLRR